MIVWRVPSDISVKKLKYKQMKYSYLILIGLLALAPATYAEVNGNAGQLSINQTNNITVKGKIVDEKGESLIGVNA